MKHIEVRDLYSRVSILLKEDDLHASFADLLLECDVALRKAEQASELPTLPNNLGCDTSKRFQILVKREQPLQSDHSMIITRWEERLMILDSRSQMASKSSSNHQEKKHRS